MCSACDSVPRNEFKLISTPSFVGCIPFYLIPRCLQYEGSFQIRLNEDQTHSENPSLLYPSLLYLNLIQFQEKSGQYDFYAELGKLFITEFPIFAELIHC